MPADSEQGYIFPPKHAPFVFKSSQSSLFSDDLALRDIVMSDQVCVVRSVCLNLLIC